MKQHITVDQLNELSDGGKDKYKDYCFRKFDDISFPLLSIGQMIEFLMDHSKEVTFMVKVDGESGKLCDLLWMRVKEVLK